jgi:hypothetical protein
MLALTHLIVALLLIQILVLDKNDAFVALVFGVFIDLDHFFGLRDYAQTNGIKAVFDLDSILNPGGHWKSMMHNPIALAMVAPLAFVSRLAIPVVFWGVHVAMDIVQEGFLGQFSQAEAMLAFLSLALLVSLRFSMYIDAGHDGDLRKYLKSEISSVRGLFSARECY